MKIAVQPISDKTYKMVTILFEPDSEVLNMDNDLPCCEYLTSSKI